MKYLIIPLLLMYAVAISGATIHAHYCGKTLVSVSMEINGDPCNDACGKKPMKCCKDKVVMLKVSNEQKTVNAFKVKAQVPLAVSIIYPTPVSTLLINTGHSSVYLSNAPPGRWQQIPLYQLHSSLVYYG